MSNDTPNLFDWLAAELARDTAIQQVSSALDPFWDRASHWAIRATAITLPAFTSDDVWQTLHSMAVTPPEEPRAMGYALQRAKALKVCQPTQQFVRSQRPAAHCRPMMIWHSLLWEPSHNTDIPETYQ